MRSIAVAGDQALCGLARLGSANQSRCCGAFLDLHPDAAQTFNANMTAMTYVEARAVASAYDFSGLQTLADIGGGQGALAAAILNDHPAARAVIFDQPSVIEGAPPILDHLGIRARCDLVGGDFFDSVPSGADVYLLKDILHDWDDERSKAILRNIRRAMSGEARLLVIERVIPSGNAPSVGKLVDITMLVMTGGRERTALQYRQLIEEVGLKLDRIVATTGSASLIEARSA